MLGILKKCHIGKKTHYEIIGVIFFSLGFLISIPQNVIAEQDTLPHWLKTTAVWWGEDKISNDDFVSALQYLVDKKILVIPEIEIIKPVCGPGLVLDELTDECIIPDESDPDGIFLDTIDEQKNIVVSWIKLTTLWWGQDKINDQDFINALQYLVENNVLILESESPPKPIIKQKPLPSELIVWPKIEKIEDFQVQGHPNIDSYKIQFKLIDIDHRSVGADGTISIAFLDDRNRILYLDSFSIKKPSYKKSFDAFDKDGNESGETVYSWKIKTSNIKSGFTPYGLAKIVFTDRYGNNFASEFDRVSIPQFN
jgi:hypothetical protein